jgi:hypothetical protein
MEAGNGQLQAVNIAVSQLRLDPDNPRLPDDLRGGEQVEILKYLAEKTVLDEIARSMVENGFFTHEPLFVLRDREDEFIVLEGNRRLATLMIVLQLPGAVDAGLEFDLGIESEPEGWRERLQAVPCHEVPTRDAVRRFLGFRHIGGMKPWSAQAKARYLHEEVLRSKEAGSDHPFRDVGRGVGSNSQGVRNAVYAYIVLLRGRDDAGIDIRYVMDNRFGVWQRALNSVELRTFLGIGWPKRFDEVDAALADLNTDHLQEVLTDMTPNGTTALLADSRDITVYGLALANSQAYEAMRKFKTLDVARQIVEEADLPDRIRRVVATIEAIQEMVTRTDQVNVDVVASSEELASVATALRAVAKDRHRDNGN